MHFSSCKIILSVNVFCTVNKKYIYIPPRGSLSSYGSERNGGDQ